MNFRISVGHLVLLYALTAHLLFSSTTIKGVESRDKDANIKVTNKKCKH